MMREMDSSWHNYNELIRSTVPRPPSEYYRSNVFLGASYVAPFEVEAAVEEGYVENILWGSDYPHVEGTWAYEESEGDQNSTRAALRYASLELLRTHFAPWLARTLSGSTASTGRSSRPWPHESVHLRSTSSRGQSTPRRDYTLAFRRIGPWA